MSHLTSGDRVSLRLNMIAVRLMSPGLHPFERTHLLSEKLGILQNVRSAPPVSRDAKASPPSYTSSSRGSGANTPRTPGTPGSAPGSRSPGTLRSIVGPSAPENVSVEDLVDVVRTKLELARAFLCLAGGPSGSREEVILAEAELSGVEGMCKGVIKGCEARIRGETQRGERDGAGVGGAGTENNRGEDGDGPGWWTGEVIKDLKGVRVEGLKVLVTVEEGLERRGRAERWRALIGELEGRGLSKKVEAPRRMEDDAAIAVGE